MIQCPKPGEEPVLNTRPRVCPNNKFSEPVLILNGKILKRKDHLLLKKVLSCLPSYTWVFSQLKHKSDLNVSSTSFSSMNIVQVQELCCTTKRIYLDLRMTMVITHIILLLLAGWDPLLDCASCAAIISDDSSSSSVGTSSDMVVHGDVSYSSTVTSKSNIFLQQDDSMSIDSGLGEYPGRVGIPSIINIPSNINIGQDINISEDIADDSMSVDSSTGSTGDESSIGSLETPFEGSLENLLEVAGQDGDVHEGTFREVDPLPFHQVFNISNLDQVVEVTLDGQRTVQFSLRFLTISYSDDNEYVLQGQDISGEAQTIGTFESNEMGLCIRPNPH